MEGIRKAIDFSVRAGAFRAGARQYPDAALTMLAAAEINSARSKAALTNAMARGGNPSAMQMRFR